MNRTILTSASPGAVLFWVLFLSQNIQAQTIVVGTNSGSNDPSSYPTPYGDSHEGMRAQYLYLAPELIAAGAKAGTINSIGFIVESTHGIGEIDNLRFLLSNTGTSSLDTAFWESPGDLVFDTVSFQPMVTNNLILLHTPFLWDGISNVLLEVCHNPSDPGAGDFSSVNASVQWTTGLPFNASRTFRANDYPDICNTSDTAQAGSWTTRPVLLLQFDCLEPSGLTVNSSTSVSAAFSWSSALGGLEYEWIVGLSGFPALPDSALFSGSTSDTFAIVSGLSSSTGYDVYVRTSCGSTFSGYIGPVGFSTASGCGDFFFDSGGSLGNYTNGEDTTVTICADAPSDVVTLDFTIFDLGAGDTMRIFNGSSIADPLLGEFSGLILPGPGPFTATTSTGCLTVQFHSDASGVGAGWEGSVSCDPPAECFDVTGINLFNLSSTGANFSWSAIFGAKFYEWQIGVEPFSPGDTPLQIDTITGTSVPITGLSASTKYDFYVRTLCTDGSVSDYFHVAFYTPPNCNNPFIDCGGNTVVASMSGTGVWDLEECDPSNPSVGKEKVFRFIAPNTRMYKIVISNVGSSGVYVDYLYKEVNMGCGPEDWQCIDDVNVTDTIDFGPLVAGTQYFLLLDPESPSFVSHHFKIIECGPLNDEATTAILLEVDLNCTGNIYSNDGATYNKLANEPDPDVDQVDGYPGRWLNEAERTVWFKFVAPPSGTVTITTDEVAQGGNDDTQIALYEAGNPADYNTFILLESDEDNGVGGFGYNAVMSYTGLTPGAEYYVQVDGFGVVYGTFCIEILEGAERALESNCINAGGSGYIAPDVNGLLPGGDRWYGIYTNPDILDLGELVSAVKPGFQDIDTVIVEINVTDTIPYSTNPKPYMPAYYNYQSTDLAASGPISVRLFFYNSEFEALKIEANAPSATINDLKATHYDGPNEDCNQLNNNFALGTVTLITPTVAMPMPATGTFYVELTIPSFGEIGVHLGNTPLPLELKYFRGKIAGKNNLLEWMTLTEKHVAWHLVERSADGANWLEIGRKPGQFNSTAPIYYTLEDDRPLAKAYYRLRSQDVDGMESASQAILLSRRQDQFGITGIFPSPTADRLNVQFAAQAEEKATFRVSDFMGRIVLEQNAEAENGINQIVLSLVRLPAGVYTVTVANDSDVSAPQRVVKQ